MQMQKGFTLIELLVVVLIIGILAAIALPQYNKAVERARLSEAVLMVSNLQRGIDMYVLEHGWPNEDIKLIGCPDAEDGKCNILDIDVESSLECNPSKKSCYTEHYVYQADCGRSTCSITAGRLGEDGGHEYWLNDRVIFALYRSRSKNSPVWGKEYDPVTDFGREIASSLEPQGWRSCC